MMNILLALKNKTLAASLVPLLSDHQAQVISSGALPHALKAKDYGVVVFDGAFASLEAIKRYDPRLEVVFLGGACSDAKTAELITRGASACLPIPVDPQAFTKTIEELQQQTLLKKETNALEEQLASK